MSDPIVHIRIGGSGEPLRQDELDRVDEIVGEAVKDAYDGDVEVVLTGTGVDIFEHPVLDDYADELADRVAKRLNAVE